jgi:sporulation protein YlmC with PRC-barrel domain
MAVLRNKQAHLEDSIGATSIIGKKVVSKGGSVVGVINEVWIDPQELRVEGIKISKGLFKQGDYVGRNYVSSINGEGAILNIDPVTEIVGLPVFDSEGKNVGKVKKVERSNQTNSIVSILVKRGGLLHSNELLIPGENIKETGKAVMLAIAVAD